MQKRVLVTETIPASVRELLESEVTIDEWGQSDKMPRLLPE